MRTLLWVFGGQLDKHFSAPARVQTSIELCRQGWKVTLVAARPPGKREVQGVEIVYLPRPNLHFIGQIAFHLTLLRLLARRWSSIDVVLFHHVSALYLLPLCCAVRIMRRRGPQFAMDTRTIHMVPEGTESARDRIRGMFWKLMEQAANRWADGRLAITELMAEVVHIPVERLWGIWPSGVNVKDFSRALEDRHWPGPSEEINLAYVGTLNYERNLMTLARAVASARDEGMTFTLFLVGDGSERADLEAFARREGGWMQVRAPVPHEEIPGILATAHLGVLPFPDEQKFQVSSPIKLFEYMAAGLPILATRIRCHTDVLQSAPYVFWAEHSDLLGLLAALKDVWARRESLRELGQQAAIAADAWSWERSATKLRLSLERGLAAGQTSEEHPSDTQQSTSLG